MRIASGQRVGNLTYSAYLLVLAATILLAPVSLRLAGASLVIFGWGWLCFRTSDVASLTGAIVTWLLMAMTIMSAWISNGTLTQAHSRLCRDIVMRMDSMAALIDDFHRHHFYLPATLAQIEFPDHTHLEQYDPWHREFVYSPEAGGFRIETFGRDGKPGGSGLDSDWMYSADHLYPDRQLPFGQYLLETESTIPVIAVSAWFGLWLGHFIRAETTRTSERARLLTAAGLLVVSVIVCTFLSMVHVAASQSGH